MPYIKRERRDLARKSPSNAGELTYALTVLVVDYLDMIRPNHYSDYAKVLGALEATKLELYRRVVAPYEALKKELNGDVY